MSHHDLPRVHFRGEFRANVTTANNDDIAAAFPTQQFVDVARVRVNTLGMDDATFAAWLRQLAPPFGIRAGWNLYGSGYCPTPASTVQSVRTAAGGLKTSSADDSLIGASVSFPRGAVMVDLDPEGTLATQIFCDEIRFAVGSQTKILGKPVRFCSREVVRRNLQAGGFTAFSASWFAAIPPDQLDITTSDSPVLTALKLEHDAGKGLFVAFCTYLLRPQISQVQLASDFASGLSTQNPAVGRWIGTLGVWSPDEMRTAPVGRRLLPSATLQHDHIQFQLNPALATIHPDRMCVTLDLLSTFPEVDETLQKVQVGSIRLGVVTTDGAGDQLHDIGEVVYDRVAYERESGLVDVPYSADKQDPIDRGRLILYRAGTNARVMTETRWTAESDDRCVYLQDGESLELTFRLHEQGRLPTSPTTVRLVQYDTTNRIRTQVPPANGVVNHAGDVHVTPVGTGVLTVTAQRPGIGIIAILPPGESDNSLAYFLNVRVLPRDNYDHVPDSNLTFGFIYDEVLRYYHLLYPFMSERINLSNQREVERSAHEIKRRIAFGMWNRVTYMPVSRDLSDGKRRLLEKWCDIVMNFRDDTIAGTVARRRQSLSSTSQIQRVGILLFNGVERLDVEGPVGVLGWVGKVTGQHLEFRMLSIDGRPVRDHLIKNELPVHGSTREADGFDVFLIPGGNLSDFVHDRIIIDEARRIGSASNIVASVCTGAFIVAQTGLADGRKMTTHWQFRSAFRRQFPHINLTEARFERDGALWSSAGISAGIDMTLQLVSAMWGEPAAKQVQDALEYYPEPIFDRGNVLLNATE